MISVFMPCTPNPTTGFFFYIAADDVIELPISADEAAKLIMSAGLIQPEGPGGARGDGGGGETRKAAGGLGDVRRLSSLSRPASCANEAAGRGKTRGRAALSAAISALAAAQISNV